MQSEMCCMVLFKYSVRFKGDNLADVLSYIFVEGKDDNDDKDVYKQKIANFDKELKDPDFDIFYKQINNGYTPSF